MGQKLSRKEALYSNHPDSVQVYDNDSKANLHPFTLHFLRQEYKGLLAHHEVDTELEAEFREDLFSRSKTVLRMWLLFGMIVVGLVFLMNYFIPGIGQTGPFFWSRYCSIIFSLFALAATYTEFCKRNTQVVLSLFVLLYGLSKTLAISEDGSITATLFPIYVFLGIRPRFPYALVTVFLDFVGYLTFVLVQQLIPPFKLATLTAFMLISLIFSAYCGYRIEWSQRMGFFLEKILCEEQEKCMSIIDNMLPDHITNRIKNGQKVIASEEKCVSVLFCSIVDFSSMVARLSAQELVVTLDKLYSAFDQLCNYFHVQKMETVGPVYMACGGMAGTRNDHAMACIELGLLMLRVVKALNSKAANPAQKFAVRVGIHSGRVLTGVVGNKKPQFSLFGDTVNMASRVCGASEATRLTISGGTAELVRNKFVLEEVPVCLKGKGEVNLHKVIGTRLNNGPAASCFQSRPASLLYNLSPRDPDPTVPSGVGCDPDQNPGRNPAPPCRQRDSDSDSDPDEDLMEFGDQLFSEPPSPRAKADYPQSPPPPSAHVDDGASDAAAQKKAAKKLASLLQQQVMDDATRGSEAEADSVAESRTRSPPQPSVPDTASRHSPAHDRSPSQSASPNRLPPPSTNYSGRLRLSPHPSGSVGHSARQLGPPSPNKTPASSKSASGVSRVSPGRWVSFRRAEKDADLGKDGQASPSPGAAGLPEGRSPGHGQHHVRAQVRMRAIARSLRFIRALQSSQHQASAKDEMANDPRLETFKAYLAMQPSRLPRTTTMKPGRENPRGKDNDLDAPSSKLAEIEQMGKSFVTPQSDYMFPTIRRSRILKLTPVSLEPTAPRHTRKSIAGPYSACTARCHSTDDLLAPLTTRREPHQTLNARTRSSSELVADALRQSDTGAMVSLRRPVTRKPDVGTQLDPITLFFVDKEEEHKYWTAYRSMRLKELKRGSALVVLGYIISHGVLLCYGQPTRLAASFTIATASLFLMFSVLLHTKPDSMRRPHLVSAAFFSLIELELFFHMVRGTPAGNYPASIVTLLMSVFIAVIMNGSGVPFFIATLLNLILLSGGIILWFCSQRSWIDVMNGVFFLMITLAGNMLASYRHEFFVRREHVLTRLLEVEIEKMEKLLHLMLPAAVVRRLRQAGHNGYVVDELKNVSLLVSDIEGFTRLAAESSPEKVLDLLSSLFTAFDKLTEKHGVSKIQTIGDAYIVASGVPLGVIGDNGPESRSVAENALSLVKMAEDMLEEAGRVVVGASGHSVKIRIGLHFCKSIVGGVIGRQTLRYDIWGGDVLIATAVEEHGIAGSILVTEDMKGVLSQYCTLAPHRPIWVEGLGPVQSYLVARDGKGQPRRPDLMQPNEDADPKPPLQLATSSAIEIDGDAAMMSHGRTFSLGSDDVAPFVVFDGPDFLTPVVSYVPDESPRDVTASLDVMPTMRLGSSPSSRRRRHSICVQSDSSQSDASPRDLNTSSPPLDVVSQKLRRSQGRSQPSLVQIGPESGPLPRPQAHDVTASSSRDSRDSSPRPGRLVPCFSSLSSPSTPSEEHTPASMPHSENHAPHIALSSRDSSCPSPSHSHLRTHTPSTQPSDSASTALDTGQPPPRPQGPKPEACRKSASRGPCSAAGELRGPPAKPEMSSGGGGGATDRKYETSAPSEPMNTGTGGTEGHCVPADLAQVEALSVTVRGMLLCIDTDILSPLSPDEDSCAAAADDRPHRPLTLESRTSGTGRTQ